MFEKITILKIYILSWVLPAPPCIQRGIMSLSQMETNSGWQAADARHPSLFRRCCSFSPRFGERLSASSRPPLTHTHSRQFTPPTLGARSPVGRILPNHTCVGRLRFSILPVKPSDLFNIELSFSFTAQRCRTTTQPDYTAAIHVRYLNQSFFQPSFTPPPPPPRLSGLSCPPSLPLYQQAVLLPSFKQSVNWFLMKKTSKCFFGRRWGKTILTQEFGIYTVEVRERRRDSTGQTLCCKPGRSCTRPRCLLDVGQMYIIHFKLQLHQRGLFLFG